MSAATQDSNTHTILRTVCSHDCPDACSVLVSVKDGKAIRFRGDPDHPFTAGFLCGKVNSYEDVVYSPDRLLHPLRRTGPKGTAEFERISWDTALSLVAENIQDAIDGHGGESLALYYYGGNMGFVNRYSADALFNRLGATQLRQNICYYGADAGYMAAVGSGYGIDPEDVAHSDFLVVWGCNVVTTQVHLVPFINEARKHGAELWAIDPYRNRTVAKADRWLAVRPGTDTALALGLMHILERDDRVDRDFVARRTVGYEKLRDEVLHRYPPEKVAAITGIDAPELEALADRLATANAPLFKVGIGIGRSSHGGAAMRSICCLAGVLGAYAKLGGGVQYDTGCEFKLNLNAVRRPDWLESPTRVMNMTDIGKALTEWREPPVQFLYVHGSNPAATAPEQRRCVRGLAREDLFTVVHERFMTDTARWADVVLPAVSFPEASDLFRSYGHLYLQFSKPVIEPPGECRTNLATIQALGKTLGLDDPWFERSVEDLSRRMLDDTDHPNFAGIDPERVLAGETLRLNLPRGESGFKDRFPTPSGKLEFYSQSLEDEGLPGLVDYAGDPFNENPAKFPLRLLTPPAHAFLNSSFCEGARSRNKAGVTPCVLVNPEDATKNQGGDSIADGDLVELFNEQGAVLLRAAVTTDTQPGVVVAEGTWWPAHSPDGRGINVLTSARLTDLGGGSTFHDNRVGLRRVTADAVSSDDE